MGRRNSLMNQPRPNGLMNPPLAGINCSTKLIILLKPYYSPAAFRRSRQLESGSLSAEKGMHPLESAAA